MLTELSRSRARPARAGLCGRLLERTRDYFVWFLGGEGEVASVLLGFRDDPGQTPVSIATGIIVDGKIVFTATAVGRGFSPGDNRRP